MQICLLITTLIFSLNLLGETTYECVVKRARARDDPGLFRPFTLKIVGRNNINIIKRLEIIGQEINMDEQFLHVKPVNCRLPGQNGRKFASAGLEESANGYRLEEALFNNNPPATTRLDYVLDVDRRGLYCKPAIYECTRTL